MTQIGGVKPYSSRQTYVAQNTERVAGESYLKEMNVKLTFDNVASSEVRHLLKFEKMDDNFIETKGFSACIDGGEFSYIFDKNVIGEARVYKIEIPLGYGGGSQTYLEFIDKNGSVKKMFTLDYTIGTNSSGTI